MVKTASFLLLTASVMVGCSQEDPAPRTEQTFGGQLGQEYKGMLDEAKSSVGNINEQMQRTEQAVQDRDR